MLARQMGGPDALEIAGRLDLKFRKDRRNPVLPCESSLVRRWSREAPNVARTSLLTL